MLSRYNNKEVRVTLEDGTIVTGSAQAYPSGYGLVEFDREEESIQIEDMQVFKSDIRVIEILPKAVDEGPDAVDALMGDLLEGPCWVVDILPGQVPADAGGQYFAVERYYLQPERASALYRRYAEILLRLNCYYDMFVTFDSCESWEKNPDPETFVQKLTNAPGTVFVRALFPAQRAMVDLDIGYTSMTVFDPEENLLDLVRPLVAAEGLFIWASPG